MLTQNLNQHKSTLASKISQIDQLNEQIRELSTAQKQEMDQFVNLQKRAKVRDERMKKIQNLRRTLADRETNRTTSPSKRKLVIGDADTIPLPSEDTMHNHVADPHTLRQHVRAYTSLNTAAAMRAAQLKSRSLELESLYRRAVALCTNVPEQSVEEHLGALVAAVESERGALGREEVGRSGSSS